MSTTQAARFTLPERLLRLPPYPLGDVPGIKARLRAEGRSLIDLGVGETDLPVPEAAVEALREACADPELQGYAFQRGLPEFRTAVADWMLSRFGRAVDADEEILPLIGSKEGIAHLAFALLDPGDSVLIPDPGYAPYFGGSALAGARIHRAQLEARNGFLVPPERIRSVPGRLRIVYLNYPNNPTGATCDRSYLEEVVAACHERAAVLVWDNAYSEIAFDGYSPPGLLEIDGGTEECIEFHSLSKSFSMTGWRLGWACGDARLIAALARVKSFIDTGAYLPIQAAGAAALRSSGRYLPSCIQMLRERRDAAVRAFASAGFTVTPPRAGLYLWMPVPGSETSEAFVRRVLSEAGVVLMPGRALGEGGEGFVRAALTVAPPVYAEAAARMRELL
jgi:LL-diaminopimelate aminotransferase